jgi:lipoprotein signal peptidase
MHALSAIWTCDARDGALSYIDSKDGWITWLVVVVVVVGLISLMEKYKKC